MRQAKQIGEEEVNNDEAFRYVRVPQDRLPDRLILRDIKQKSQLEASAQIPER